MERRVGYPEEFPAIGIGARYLDLKPSGQTKHELQISVNFFSEFVIFCRLARETD
jgi:hypothetical protein